MRIVNDVSRPGNTMARPVSGGQAVLKHELELSQNHVPISTSGGPVLDNFPAGQVEYLSQGIIVGEAGLILGNLAELAVEALNDIGRVYDFPNLRSCTNRLKSFQQSTKSSNGTNCLSRTDRYFGSIQNSV